MKGPITLDEIRDLLANPKAWEAVQRAVMDQPGFSCEITDATRIAYADERARQIIQAFAAYVHDVERLIDAATDFAVTVDEAGLLIANGPEGDGPTTQQYEDLGIAIARVRGGL